MFLPLDVERFEGQFLTAHQTWKRSDIWYHAKYPRYIHHEIEKKRPKKSILIEGADDPPVTKMRLISEPCPGLKVLHRYILRMILNPAKDCLMPCAHGCVEGRSTVTNATPHVGARLKIHMDLKDFFPTITTPRIYGLYHTTFGYGTKLAWLLSNLSACNGSLPQGAATSPMIANLIATPMDRRIVWLANAMGAYYTRYVDDLTFSFRRYVSGSSVARFVDAIRKIVAKQGFRVNEEKTSVVTRKGRMVVTGVVVNSKASIPIWFRRNLRAAIHQLKRFGGDESEILGRLAYVQGVCKSQSVPLYRQLRK